MDISDFAYGWRAGGRPREKYCGFHLKTQNRRIFCAVEQKGSTANDRDAPQMDLKWEVDTLNSPEIDITSPQGR